MHTLGRMTRRLADVDDPGNKTRAAIREVLGAALADIRDRLDLVASALGGRDPEFALFSFVQVMENEVPKALRSLEAGLSKRVAKASRGAA